MPMMGHLPRGASLPVQYNRVVRWYRRMKAISAGEFHNLSIDMDCDEILIFFIFCHQLKDWIINDTEIPRQVVESYINSNQCLAICADIANGTKHLGIGDNHRPRSGEDFRMRPGVVISGDNLNQVQLQLYVTLDGSQIRALDIATECMQKWTVFLRAHDHFAPERMADYEQ